MQKKNLRVARISYMHRDAYMLYSLLRIFCREPTSSSRRNRHVEKSKHGSLSSGTVSGCDAGTRCGHLREGRFARGSVSADRRPRGRGPGKGRQGQQVSVHLLLRRTGRTYRRHEGRLSGGDGEDDRPGQWDSDLRGGPRREADCGQVRRSRGSHAAGVGDRCPPGPPPARSRNNSTRPNSNRRSSAPARPSA